MPIHSALALGKCVRGRAEQARVRAACPTSRGKEGSVCRLPSERLGRGCAGGRHERVSKPMQGVPTERRPLETVFVFWHGNSGLCVATCFDTYC